jgi:uncharacterized OB-fold protein
MKTWPYENIYYRMRKDGPYLIASRCGNCNHITFPKKNVCPACVTPENMEEIELSREGKIDTFSELHVGPPGFPLPYLVGYVKLPEGPKVFSVICHDADTGLSPTIGSPVKLILGKIRKEANGDEVMGFQFSLTDDETGAS